MPNQFIIVRRRSDNARIAININHIVRVVDNKHTSEPSITIFHTNDSTSVDETLEHFLNRIEQLYKK